MSPKVFKKYKTELLDNIKKWIVSDKTYTVRFAIGMLMEHYLTDEDFAEIKRLALYLEEIPDYLALDVTTEYRRLKLEFEHREDI